MAFNSDNFDLSLWRATLPVDENGGTSGKAVTVKDLTDFEHSEFFYDAPDGAMVFRSSVDGARTSSSTKYTRTELREADADGTTAWWGIEEGGTMTATLRVDEIPESYKDKYGGMVIGQIHGKKDELVRLYYDEGDLYFVNEHSKEDGKEHRFDLFDDVGETPDVEVGETFSYMIQVSGGNTLTVEVYADDKIYSSVSSIDDFWLTDQFYYKAGLYMANNEDNGAGYGQLSFYGLDHSHVEGEGYAGVILELDSDKAVDATISYADAAQSVKVDLLDESKSAGNAEAVDHTGVNNLVGSAHKDNLKGNKEDNVIEGGEGRDFLYGRYGNDTLIGGEGHDVLQGQSSDDALSGGNGKDKLDGGSGNDALSGGGGRDFLFGGEGNDAFIFDALADSNRGAGMDQVEDFERGLDVLDLSNLGFLSLDDDGGKTEVGEVRLAYSDASDRTYVLSDQEDFMFFLKGDYSDLDSDSFIF